MYTILGDPSLRFWTEVPEPMLVSMDPPWAPVDQTTDVAVSVADSVTADPVADALVCLMREDDVYAYGYTDENGNVVLPITPQSGQADGIDTLGLIARFQQGATITDVTSPVAYSNPSIGLVVEFLAPAGLVSGPVALSVRLDGESETFPIERLILP